MSLSRSVFKHQRPARSAGGFALLMTITLLAFAVLLLVGLATYTRVETAIAGNMQRQAQARENALTALNVALGQLQKHAGPDTRITATAESEPGVDAEKSHYTGVWPSSVTTTTVDDVTTSDAKKPLAWLVSGSETGTLEDVAAPIPAANKVTLLGAATATGGNVTARLQDIRSPGVPGQSGSATIGRYAWWVGDQGVKAPVAIGEPAKEADYAPYDSAELRARRRQQVPLGAAAADSTGAAVFEPLDENNKALVKNVTVPNQLAFLRSGSNAQLGLASLRQNFHAWSPNNYGVIANTKLGGLKQDLSLMPSLLGDAFVAWANYPAYMEKLKPDPVAPADGSTTTSSDAGTAGDSTTPVSVGPDTSAAPQISPAYSADPVRRRYVMTPQVRGGNGSHQVAPVLTYFLLTFNVRTLPTASNQPSRSVQPLEVRARWMASFWNPYTSAMVPENLRIEVRNLPNVVRVVNDSALRGGTVGSFNLGSAAVFGSPLRINLPWDTTSTSADAPVEDRQSWLPGRVYTWRSIEDVTKSSSPPAEGFASQFYSRDLNDSGRGVIRPLSLPAVDGSDECHLEVSGPESLRVTLYAARPGGDVQLGSYTSPAFLDSFVTDAQPVGDFGYQFSYVFRLTESIDTPETPGSWLTAGARDFRRRTLTSDFFRVEAEGNNPGAYKNYTTISKPDRLLDRAPNAWSYNEDVPVFELPRAPILSLGTLQHFRTVGTRPFMIGNPWGVNFGLNNIPLGELFDRFYFSGFVDGTVPTTTATGDLIAPSPLLRVVRSADGTKPTIGDVRATIAGTTTPTDGTTTPTEPTSEPSTEPSEETPTDGTPLVPSLPGGRSSKFFLQSGAFNLNSTSAAAWRAVLRGVRYPAPSAFSYLDVSTNTGSAADDAVAAPPSTGDANFFRFAQSAQETYKAEPGMADDSGTSPARTELFRRGIRTLEGAKVALLAARIAELVAMKRAADEPLGGPFRSVQEFLSPSALFTGATLDADGNSVMGAPRSLLEAAIADTDINNGIDFSSQFLTQADVMTALAPVLFARSDTFIIRAYGEVLNPTTSNVEGRAWCEALVQRLPEYFADPANTPADMLPSGFEPATNPDAPDDPPTSSESQQLNKQLGRRFKIVSFRWLTRSDI